jgi:hypothetical protein
VLNPVTAQQGQVKGHCLMVAINHQNITTTDSVERQWIRH